MEAMVDERGGAGAGASAGFLDKLQAQPADLLLALIGAFRDDVRTAKIDVGVGVYRDEAGATPVMRAIKEAERRLLAEQQSKVYLGPEGDIGFFEALKPIVLGERDLGPRVAGLQTPGGTGALRLAFELVARANPAARVWIGQPTWPNHPPIVAAAGLEIVGFEHFDTAAQRLTFDSAMAALDDVRRGDVVLLHGCCHNPTGADLDADQWAAIAALLARKGAFPIVDLAYQGLGQGLDEDASGARIVIDTVGEALVAYSCDKNFGMYRDRTGALFAIASDGETARTVHTNLLSLARANWSMPPDHGAAVVRIVLEDTALREDWTRELAGMRERMRGIRTMLADASPFFAPLAGQHGMFSMLPLTPQEVARLREDFGIYMPASGRINVAGLTPATVPPFVDALASIR